MRRLAIALSAGVTAISFAQTSSGPPADAMVPDASRLRVAISGQVFKWRTESSERSAPGTTARMRFTEAGLVTADMSSGAFDTGSWSVDGSNLCFHWKTFDSGCNAVRISGDTLWLRHSNGKWSAMTLMREAKSARTAG